MFRCQLISIASEIYSYLREIKVNSKDSLEDNVKRKIQQVLDHFGGDSFIVSVRLQKKKKKNVK